MNHLSLPIASLQRNMVRTIEDYLEQRNFTYVKVPSLLKASDLARQELGFDVFHARAANISGDLVLTGSAEQGILSLFSDSEIPEGNYFSTNQCFRNENELQVGLRQYEFEKIEMMAFYTEPQAASKSCGLLLEASHIVKSLGLTYRIRPQDDPGYHLFKYDIEVLTQRFGWIETHSYTYFGTEQSQRYGIKINGEYAYTASCTAAAFPRILIPYLEIHHPNLLSGWLT